MIKITNTDVWGFDGAIRGMRNPYMSHEKSDSMYKDEYYFSIGEKDMELAKKLIKAGSEHRKFLRMIHVQADILAPRYWWAEMDTYKHVNMNSSSTMHLITKRILALADFSIENLNGEDLETFKDIINNINEMITSYQFGKATIDESMMNYYFQAIKRLLPESYNQLRTIDTNYECLLNIYRQRKNHRLIEWKEFCKWVESLPYKIEYIKNYTFLATIYITNENQSQLIKIADNSFSTLSGAKQYCDKCLKTMCENIWEMYEG